jgi:hypothetical protein
LETDGFFLEGGVLCVLGLPQGHEENEDRVFIFSAVMSGLSTSKKDTGKGNERRLKISKRAAF